MNHEQAKLELYKVRDMGQMMGFAANLVRRHWKHMFRTIGLMSLPLMLMASTFYYLGTADGWEGYDPALGNPRGNAIGLNMIFAYIAIYITYATILWGTVYYVKLYEEKGPENFQWNDIWAKVFAHGWWLILSNIMIFILLGIAAGLSFLLVLTVILTPVTLLILLALMALSQVWTVIYLFEARGLFSALDRSFKLLQKQWFKAIALLVCSYMVVSGFVMLPAYLGLFGSLLGGNVGIEDIFSEENIWLILLIQNLSSILSFFTTFFVSLSFIAFYLSNVERLEKVSLKARVEKLSEDSTLSTYS
ncbi:MAG: hypothetical protein ACYC1Q_05590 [Bacteroidia bacterium]